MIQRTSHLTSYDLLKALALILMITDHVGHHFYPDEMWFRVLGRLCVPIWFFLIGYARTDAVSPKILLGGAIVTLSALVAGQYVFPLDILFTIALIRKTRHGCVIRATQSPQNLRGWFLLLLFAAVPTGLLFEYGTLGIMFVLQGFIARNRAVLKERLKPWHTKLFAYSSVFFFGILQGVFMPSLTLAQVGVLFVGLFAISALLERFKAADYPALTRVFTRPGTFLIHIMGRRTMEIYVLHILIFRGICMALYPDTYAFLDWHWAPPGLISWFF